MDEFRSSTSSPVNAVFVHVLWCWFASASDLRIAILFISLGGKFAAVIITSAWLDIDTIVFY